MSGWVILAIIAGALVYLGCGALTVALAGRYIKGNRLAVVFYLLLFPIAWIVVFFMLAYDVITSAWKGGRDE